MSSPPPSSFSHLPPPFQSIRIDSVDGILSAEINNSSHSSLLRTKDEILAEKNTSLRKQSQDLIEIENKILLQLQQDYKKSSIKDRSLAYYGHCIEILRTKIHEPRSDKHDLNLNNQFISKEIRNLEGRMKMIVDFDISEFPIYDDETRSKFAQKSSERPEQERDPMKPPRD